MFVWSVPLGGACADFETITRGAHAAGRKELGLIGRTLSFYLAQRFARTVFAAFMVVFVIIYAADLVELLRRSGDSSARQAF